MAATNPRPRPQPVKSAAADKPVRRQPKLPPPSPPSIIVLTPNPFPSKEGVFSYSPEEKRDDTSK
jgi:hypothetical protein